MRNINKLREERNNQIMGLEQNKSNIQGDSTRSVEYKREQTQKIDKDIQATREKYEPKIYEGIQKFKSDKLQEVHNAEFDIKPEEATIELLKEMRVQAKTNELVGKYKGTDTNIVRSRLIDEATELAQANSPYSKSYIAAMETLGVAGIGYLKEQIEASNLNSKQLKSRQELEEIKQVERDFNRETNNNPITEVLDDIFKEKLAKYQ